MIRSFADLRIHWIDGAPWFEGREVTSLLCQQNTSKVTRHIVHGHRQWHYIYGRGYRSKCIVLLDSTALIEAWTALTSGTPVYMLRAFLADLMPAVAV